MIQFFSSEDEGREKEQEKMSLSCFQIKDFMGDIEGEINQRLKGLDVNSFGLNDNSESD